MSKHLFGQILTHYGTAANNRGETEGNITTLQKLLWKGETHTTVSAESIRWAVRYLWQKNGEETNRTWDAENSEINFADTKWSAWSDKPPKGAKKYLDDDALGFMQAEAGKQDGEKGTATIRKGILEFTRALSTAPFAGDITFNAKSGTKSNTSLYGTEVHATRYQYGFSITPEFLSESARVFKILDAILNLNQVAGNQSRFLYDFSPESVILRWTDDFAPRILYSFEEKENEISIPSVVEKVDSGDIEPETIIIAGPIAKHPDVAQLKQKKVSLFPGVKQAFEEVQKRIKQDLNLKD
ncbi:MAG TPA: type I-B CRISPR-associated protein Cas7/Cst2/DevR [Leptospiraceae bacterium]|nr:type I-B CRISPR-associated protein Cas7/Cst2/DevR [Leptospiraceae bacterium]HNF12641.1 type I-B CRISPR-associated protein Cas7/Cst2/DevR [Leptospiraceae bacterium]HNF26836.1 type I-B CRISPR-associated protein Cas7/Cst2/DevR [Leptospiraceae bacterium]HNI99390.1 type I-B CRISPR-associated protein Cas7/Cst2/DevR [Leptospiraceae bacterium]HNM02176.1 type I-B CRISPR-associated protein Cas7/Cst2/DevR [Leptospiraceae bacterium]